METSNFPATDRSLEDRVVSLERGVRLFAVTILLLSGIPGFVLALAIKPFASEILMVKHQLSISPVYLFVLEHPVYFITVAALLPTIGIIITARAKNPFRAMLAACVYLLIVLVQFSITWASFVSSARALLISGLRL